MIYLVTNNEKLTTNEVYTVISVEESLDILNKLDIIGLDTETEGFSPYLKKLLLLQLGNRHNQIVIDCRTVDIQLYKELLENKDKLFLGWNLKFDSQFLFYHNIIPNIHSVYDGFLAEKLIWLGYPTGMHSLSLKSAGENYLGIELDKSVRGEIIWRKELTNSIIEYSANDVKYLEDIMNKQMEILNSRGQQNAIKLENAALLPTAYFEYCGVKLDRDKWKLKMDNDKTKYDKTLEKLNNWCIAHYPNDKRFCFLDLQGSLFDGFQTEPTCIINWNSQQQVIPLFEELGFNLEVPDKEKGGIKKSVEDSIISKYKDKSDLVPIYLEYKALQKVISTYGQNFLDLINPVTNRIHTKINQIGTDTQRYSSGGGNDTEVIPNHKVPYINIQNLPADSETRACFVAENGNVWISRDYSGEESVILANISKDKAMIELFQSDHPDLHSLVAKMIYPNELKDIEVKDIKKLRPDLRKKAKGPE